MKNTLEQAMNPDRLKEKIDRAARMVDEYLLRFIRDEEQIPRLHEGMIYSLGLDTEELRFRGKRLRPALGILVCEALGGNTENFLPLASAIEIFHNFTLVHDDIEDGDAFRRNRPCVYKHFGTAHGINIGDFMLVKAFRSIIDPLFKAFPPQIGTSVLDMLLEAFEHTHVGQALDINARSSRDFSVPDYLHLVKEKTGYCLAASMLAAAVITEAPSGIRNSMAEYAHAVGPLFQIRDDMIDLTRGKGRKSIGSDIREGKRSYLVAHVCGKCTSEERDRLFEILDAPREDTGDADVDWVIDLFQRHKSFESAGKENERLLNKALEACGEMPEILQELLVAFAMLLVERSK